VDGVHTAVMTLQFSFQPQPLHQGA
jgi:hypothetical protein